MSAKSSLFDQADILAKHGHLLTAHRTKILVSLCKISFHDPHENPVIFNNDINDLN